jgi:serine/threonine kinase 32
MKQHPGSNLAFAMKYINKAKCIEQKMVDSIIGERMLLEEISSLFVVNLRYAFQDKECMFMVLDLKTGGDLRFHMDQGNKIGTDLVKFWMAELSYALSVIHSRNILHRDMKPDVCKCSPNPQNVLLDSEGHVYLTDFNIACHFRPEKKLV